MTLSVIPLKAKQKTKNFALFDEIIKNPPCPITKEFIHKHNIDLVVHADDMSQQSLNHWYKAPMELGKFKTVSYTKGISTSEILNRIKTRIQNGTL